MLEMVAGKEGMPQREGYCGGEGVGGGSEK